jgi:hypothetical protein
MQYKLSRQIILIIVLLISACNPAPQVTQLSSDTIAYDEIIYINNCGNKAESTQTASRSFSTKVSGTGTIKAGYDKIIEGGVSATYEQFRNTTKTQTLTAAPQTNMEFILRWSDDVRTGNATINGESADYIVNIPISVAQTSSRDLGCAGPESTPSSPEATNWAFVLEYHFPSGFWSVGTHSYSFAFTCPNEAPDSVTRDFTVSDNFPSISGDIYLRWSALRVGNPWGEIVDGINPSQSTVASVAWDTITKSEAEWRTSNCTGTISWDGGATEPLTGISFQH